MKFHSRKSCWVIFLGDGLFVTSKVMNGIGNWEEGARESLGILFFVALFFTSKRVRISLILGIRALSKKIGEEL